MGAHKLAIGTVQMGLDYGINNRQGQISQSESFEILRNAFRAGIDTLDTAEAYGNAHTLIGDFHRTYPSSVFKIITKVATEPTSLNFEDRIPRFLEELGVSEIETLMFHSYPSFVENKAALAGLRRAREKGYVKNLGVSIYKNEELLELIALDYINVIQLPFNLLDNHTQKGECLALAKSKNKTIHTRSAFLQGLFFMDRSSDHSVVRALQKELRLIDTLSKEYEVPVEALALNYCLSQNFIDKVIIGVDSVDQLTKNLRATQFPLEQTLIDRIDRLIVKNANLLNPAEWPIKSC